MQSNILKSAMQNGLIMGILFSINFLLSTKEVGILVLLTYGIALLILNLTYRFSIRFRENDCMGVISYRKSASYIILVFFYAALISTVIKYVYIQYLDTSYLELKFQETLKLMETLKFPMSKAEIQQSESMFKPVNFLFLYIWSNIILGSLVALVMALFIKKDKKVL